jgi:hypothetical protein
MGLSQKIGGYHFEPENQGLEGPYFGTKHDKSILSGMRPGKNIEKREVFGHQ